MIRPTASSPCPTTPSRAVCRLLLALALWVATGLAGAADVVATVVDVTGAATLVPSRALPILTELRAGDRVTLARDGRVAIVFSESGRQDALHGPGTFQVGPRGIEALDGGRVVAGESVNAAWRNVRLRTTRAAQASIPMRGGAEDGGLQLVAPVTTWVLEAQPEFRWVPPGAGLEYHFQITDDTGKVLYETRTRDAALRLPASVALTPGTTYAWQVETRRADEKRAEGWTEFGIAGPAVRARLEAARPAAGAPFAARVMFAALLDSLGLHDDARSAWSELARERPDEARLQALRGQR